MPLSNLKQFFTEIRLEDDHSILEDGGRFQDISFFPFRFSAGILFLKKGQSNFLEK